MFTDIVSIRLENEHWMSVPVQIGEYSLRYSLGRGRQTTGGLSTTAIFSFVAGYFSETLEMRPALLYGNTQSVVRFSSMPKCMTLNDLEWLFRVKFCFRAVCLAPTVRLSKNSCVKTNKDRHILSAAQISGMDSTFWQYKVCADIRSGSLERRRLRTVRSHVNAHLERLFLAFENNCVKLNTNTDRPIL